MGMYDTVMINIKCPRCGKESIMEAQTKDLECNLHVKYPGDNVGTDKLKYLDAIPSCYSPECVQWEKDEYKGRISGFGYTFDVKIFIGDNNEILDKYEIYEETKD